MPDSKLNTLLARLVDETITPTEFQELERQLENNPDAQRRYLHYLDLHADLQDLDAVRPGAGPARRRLMAGLLALAAMFIATLFYLSLPSPAKPLVEVVDTDGPVRWIGAGAKSDVMIRPGNELPVGTLETLSADSWVEFSFPDQTSVSMAGQSVLTFSMVDGQKILRLENGNLSIKASKQPEGHPLQVITPSSETEVLGTQFNVRANAFSTRIVVNEGRVRVTRLADGQIENVDADEFLIAALEKSSDFVAVPRRAYVESWESVLPRDRRQGQWEPAEEPGQAGGVRAIPHLWKGEMGRRQNPILLYTVVLDPSPRRQPPFRVAEGARLRVQGRMDPNHKRVQLGFATNHPRGGFSGKYSLPRGTPVETNEAGQFALDLGMEMFSPKKKGFPSSPHGQEVVYLWIQTVEVDAGLVVESVEWGE
ncbi:MAG: ferric-dicitrate binding protein FerR (iron transport regulator) [Kiritimatiellia bacterium]|jgi:ferric-dicitrate binding protein FerR (iron transport regulator)